MPDAGALDPLPLKTQTYRFLVDGTRPVMQFDISSGKGADPAGGMTEKLTIELHTPMSGEVFEARTSVGRIEVDRDGRVMYFAQKGEKVGFTLFVGRSVVVTMTRSTGEVVVQSPSRMKAVERLKDAKADELGNAPGTDTVRIALE